MTAVVEDPKPRAKSTPAQKKRLIISLGDKGGVGKSFLIRKIAELHMESKTPNLLLVDGDASVSSIFKFHGDAVEPFHLHGSVDARDRFVNDLLRRDKGLIIADMPAASLSTLREMATEYNFAEEVARAGYRMTVVSPITPYDDPLLDFQEAVTMIDPASWAQYEPLSATRTVSELAEMPGKPKTNADYVAIVNNVIERGHFEEWDQPNGFSKGLLLFVGGVEVEVPALRPTIAATLQRHRLSFKAGETSEHLTITDRGRLQRWNGVVDAALRGVGERLGF